MLDTAPCLIGQWSAHVAAVEVTRALPAVLMIGGLLLLIWALRHAPHALRPPAARVPPVPPSLAPGSDPVGTVMRDAEELASLLAGQMDRQAARLERLIADADERIRRLERLAAAASDPA